MMLFFPTEFRMHPHVDPIQEFRDNLGKWIL